MTWCWAETSVSFRMNCIMSRLCDRPLLRMSTTVLLSAMVFLDHSCPQRLAAIIIEYISEMVEEGAREENGLENGPIMKASSTFFCSSLPTVAGSDKADSKLLHM